MPRVAESSRPATMLRSAAASEPSMVDCADAMFLFRGHPGRITVDIDDTAWVSDSSAPSGTWLPMPRPHRSSHPRSAATSPGTARPRLHRLVLPRPPEASGGLSRATITGRDVYYPGAFGRWCPCHLCRWGRRTGLPWCRRSTTRSRGGH